MSGILLILKPNTEPMSEVEGGYEFMIALPEVSISLTGEISLTEEGSDNICFIPQGEDNGVEVPRVVLNSGIQISLLTDAARALIKNWLEFTLAHPSFEGLGIDLTFLESI